MYAFIPWKLVVDPLRYVERTLGTAVLASENHGLPTHYDAHSEQRPVWHPSERYFTLFPCHISYAFLLFPPNWQDTSHLRVLPHDVHQAVYLSSHRTQQPRHLCHIFYSSQSRKLRMINFKFFCFHADSNSVLSVFCTTQIADSLKTWSL